VLIFHNPITHYLAVKHYCQTFRNRLATIRSAWSAEIKEHVVSVLSSRHRVLNAAAALRLLSAAVFCPISLLFYNNSTGYQLILNNVYSHYIRICTTRFITVLLRTSTTSSFSAPTILDDVNYTNSNNFTRISSTKDPSVGLGHEPGSTDMHSQSVNRMSGTLCLVR